MFIYFIQDVLDLAIVLAVIGLFYLIRKIMIPRSSYCYTAIKVASWGYLIYAILSIIAIPLLFVIKQTSAPSWIFRIIDAGILLAAIMLIWKMTIFCDRKSPNIQHQFPEGTNLSINKRQMITRFGYGVFLFILIGIITFISSMIISFVCFFKIFDWNLNTYDNFYSPVKVPLNAHSSVHTTLKLTERPVSPLPTDYGIMLIVDDHKGKNKEFPDFFFNNGGKQKMSIYYIPSKSTSEQGFVWFTNGWQSEYLNLDLLEIKEPNADKIDNSKRRFIGTYLRGYMNTKAEEPDFSRTK